MGEEEEVREGVGEEVREGEGGGRGGGEEIVATANNTKTSTGGVLGIETESGGSEVTTGMEPTENNFSLVVWCGGGGGGGGGVGDLVNEFLEFLGGEGGSYFGCCEGVGNCGGGGGGGVLGRGWGRGGRRF